MQNFLPIILSLDLLPQQSFLFSAILEYFVSRKDVNNKIISTQLLKFVGLLILFYQAVKFFFDISEKFFFVSLLLFSYWGL